MHLFIKTSMWLALVGVILRGVVVATRSEYPRSVEYERWEDVLHMFGGAAWTFWAWSLIYR
jgi:hypothetical protein